MKQLDLDPACAGHRERLSARHDGESVGDGADLARHLDHLKTCPACAAFERQLDALDPLFDPLRQTTPPPTLFDRIAEELPEQGAPVLAGPTTGTWYLRAAAGLVGFLSVIGLSRWRGAEAPLPDSSSLELFARVERALDHRLRLGSLPEREFLTHFTSTAEDQR